MTLTNVASDGYNHDTAYISNSLLSSPPLIKSTDLCCMIGAILLRVYSISLSLHDLAVVSISGNGLSPRYQESFEQWAISQGNLLRYPHTIGHKTTGYEPRPNPSGYCYPWPQLIISATLRSSEGIPLLNNTHLIGASTILTCCGGFVTKSSFIPLATRLRSVLLLSRHIREYQRWEMIICARLQLNHALIRSHRFILPILQGRQWSSHRMTWDRIHRWRTWSALHQQVWARVYTKHDIVGVCVIFRCIMTVTRSDNGGVLFPLQGERASYW